MNITIFETLFSEHILSTFVMTALLSIAIMIIGLRIKKLKPTDSPKGILMLVEMIVDFVNKFSKDNFGKYWKYYAPYILTLGLFLVFSNTFGMTGFVAPTSTVNVTGALAIITFLLIHASGILSNGIFGHIKGFMEPIPVMLPLNLIGEIATPIALSLRLFGNIFSGSIIIGLVYSLLGPVSPLFTPFLHAIFDIFFGVIQAIVFVLLTTIFVSGQLNLEEE